jgi:hypothetical protein
MRAPRAPVLHPARQGGSHPGRQGARKGAQAEGAVSARPHLAHDDSAGDRLELVQVLQLGERYASCSRPSRVLLCTLIHDTDTTTRDHTSSELAYRNLSSVQ